MDNKYEKAIQLYNLAIALSEKQPEAASVLSELVKDVIEIVKKGQDESKIDRTKYLFTQIFQKQIASFENYQKISRRLNSLLDLFRQSVMHSKYTELLKLIENVDVNKLTDPVLQEVWVNSFANLMNKSLPVWYYSIGVTHISTYYSTYFACEIHRSFLNRPSISDKAIEASIAFAEAIGEEFIGEAIPLFGLVKVITELTKSYLEKEFEKVDTTVSFMDRIFLLDNNLAILSNYMTDVDSAIISTINDINTNEVKFLNEADYLIEFLKMLQKRQ